MSRIHIWWLPFNNILKQYNITIYRLGQSFRLKDPEYPVIFASWLYSCRKACASRVSKNNASLIIYALKFFEIPLALIYQVFGSNRNDRNWINHIYERYL